MRNQQSGQSRRDTILTIALLLATFSIGAFVTHSLQRPTMVASAGDPTPLVTPERAPSASPTPSSVVRLTPSSEVHRPPSFGFGRGRYFPPNPKPTLTPTPR
jgi:hypothetical protein